MNKGKISRPLLKSWKKFQEPILLCDGLTPCSSLDNERLSLSDLAITWNKVDFRFMAH